MSSYQIGFLKMCGRALDKFQRIPFAVLEHLNAQVGGSPPDLATLGAFYSKSPRILYRHQQLALDVLGLVRFEPGADAPRVLDAICDKVRAGVGLAVHLAQKVMGWTLPPFHLVETARRSSLPRMSLEEEMSDEQQANDWD